MSAAAASSPLISITTPSNSASSLCKSKTLHSQNPMISIPKTHFKTPKISLDFITYYLNFTPLSRSSLLPSNCFASDEAIQLVKNPESEPSAIEEYQPKSPEAGRLYVGNLPFTMTSSELSQVFQEAGSVVSVEIIYDRVTGRSRGFAFVTMASVEEAKEAIRMFNGSRIRGRPLRVDFSEAPRGVMCPNIRSSDEEFTESPHKLCVRNLAWTITKEKLKEVFADRPGLLSAKVLYDKNTPKSLGFGFVTFSSAEAAESTFSAMNGIKLEGRPLRLNLFTARKVQASTPKKDSS